MKASLPSSLSVYRRFAGDWFPCAPDPSDPMLLKSIDQLLRFYPVGARTEMCSSVCCHRSELVFGRLWSHPNLTESTHQLLDELVGGIHLTTLLGLMNMGTLGEVTDGDGVGLATEEGLDRIRGLKVLLIHGEQSDVYKLESTEKSEGVLNRAGAEVQRRVFKGKGHLDCWMGRDVKDVVEAVESHLEGTEG